MGSILIIDDDTYICNLLERYFQNKGIHARATYTAGNGLSYLKQKKFDVVLCDYRLPDSDGMKMLKAIKQINADTHVVIITAYADVRQAVQLIKAGATDYVTKPVFPEEILELVKKLGKSSNSTPDQIEPFEQSFIIGNNQRMKEILKHAKIVAPTNMTVLINGETGAGKEYVARAIHYYSKRKEQPFVAVDCGAIPRELANSELFGHVKGSFTGAVNDKMGYFEYANGGTLFLDEIGNLPYEVQVKILRVIQERVITRVGDKKNISIDVRIIAATNEDLIKGVKDNNFREDLYHRLNEFKINLPPLRERKDDIMEFAHHFLNLANKSLDKQINGFSSDAQHLLIQYPWHGNLRELKNVVKRGVLLSEKATVGIESFPEEIIHYSPLQDNTLQEVSGLRQASKEAEKEIIMDALKQANNNKTRAAKLLNIDRKTLYNKIKQYDILTTK